MELTYLTDYGIRVLLYAGAHDDRRVTLRELSSAYGISLEHLRKVVHKLARVGYLRTERGRSGGLALALPAERIRVGEVVVALEHSLQIVDCERQPCSLCGVCTLKDAFNDARAAFIERLNRYTLADLLDERMRPQLHELEPAD